MESMQYEFFAFISYKREDEKMAKKLQKGLESYTLSPAIRKKNPQLPAKVRPIFRDQSDLSSGNLKTEIEKGLNESKFLIVICSPKAAKSPWVSKEVQYFIDQGREDYIIPFIIGGIPNAKNPEEECLPEGLRQLTGEKEILGININDIDLEAATIKVIARMLNLKFDTLWQRHKKELKRKYLGWGILAIIIVIASLIFAAFVTDTNTRLEYSNKEIKNEKQRADSINHILTQSRDSLIFNNKLLLKLNAQLKKLSDSISFSNKILEERNKMLSKGISDTKRIFNTIKYKTSDKDILQLISKTYQQLGGRESLYTEWLLRETEAEVLPPIAINTRQDSIKQKKEKLDKIEITFN